MEYEILKSQLHSTCLQQIKLETWGFRMSTGRGFRRRVGGGRRALAK